MRLFPLFYILVLFLAVPESAHAASPCVCKKQGDRTGADLFVCQLQSRIDDPHCTLACVGCDLRNLVLVGVDRTNFHDIDLRNANLSGVDFTGINLQGVNFAGANVTGATFTGAQNVNLADTKR